MHNNFAFNILQEESIRYNINLFQFKYLIHSLHKDTFKWTLFDLQYIFNKNFQKVSGEIIKDILYFKRINNNDFQYNNIEELNHFINNLIIIVANSDQALQQFNDYCLPYIRY